MRLVDFTGKRFGKLVVVERSATASPYTLWTCRCDCGGRREARADYLQRGWTKDCGCFRELGGKVFGRLTVVARVENSPFGQRQWRCRCSCGGEATVLADNLRRGHTVSCGCAKRDAAMAMGKAQRVHGGTGTAEFRSWTQMIARCERPTTANYARYGGRGIKVCARWRRSFAVFLADMGPKPSSTHTLDRRDNDADYTPDNCRWATKTEQARNRAVTKYVLWEGARLCLAEVAELTGIPYGTLKRRLASGYTIEAAATQPRYRHFNKRKWRAS